MSSDSAQTKLYIFVLVLNLVFPPLAYTFTSFGDVPEDYQADISRDALMSAGILLQYAESHNTSYDGGWVYFTEINSSVRCQFMDKILSAPYYTDLGDGIQFQRQTPIAKAFNTWISVYRLDVKSHETNLWMDFASNSTIVSDWNNEYNWTRFSLSDGHLVLITPHESHGNISKAVYEEAHLNVTIGKEFQESSDLNFRSFISWYSNILIGEIQWGLPAIFSWFIRILSALSILAVVMLMKELLSL